MWEGGQHGGRQPSEGGGGSQRRDQQSLPRRDGDRCQPWGTLCRAVASPRFMFVSLVVCFSLVGMAHGQCASNPVSGVECSMELQYEVLNDKGLLMAQSAGTCGQDDSGLQRCVLSPCSSHFHLSSFPVPLSYGYIIPLPLPFRFPFFSLPPRMIDVPIPLIPLLPHHSFNLTSCITVLHPLSSPTLFRPPPHPPPPPRGPSRPRRSQRTALTQLSLSFSLSHLAQVQMHRPIQGFFVLRPKIGSGAPHVFGRDDEDNSGQEAEGHWESVWFGGAPGCLHFERRRLV